MTALGRAAVERAALECIQPRLFQAGAVVALQAGALWQWGRADARRLLEQS